MKQKTNITNNLFKRKYLCIYVYKIKRLEKIRRLNFILRDKKSLIYFCTYIYF